MSLMASNSGGGGDFKEIEAGTHIARCFAVVDLGTKDNEYQGDVRKRHQIMVQWEFPNELIQEGDYAGQPFSISKFYTLSLHEKANLRHDLEGWRGKAFTADEEAGFDVSKLIGVPCMLSVVKVKKNNGKERMEVNSVSTMLKGVQCPPQVNPDKFFSFEAWDEETFNSLSDGIKKMIMESDDYKGIMKVTSAMHDDPSMPPEEPPFNPEDDIPF